MLFLFLPVFNEKVRVTTAIMLCMNDALDEEVILMMVNELEAQNILVFVFVLVL